MNYTDRMGEMNGMGSAGSEYVTLPLCERRASLESAGEYTLPDDQPEIRRVLSVTPTVLPPAKYVGGSGVELGGTVDYSVLYVGADGGLYSMPLSSEYHLTLPFEGAPEIDPMGGVTVWSDVAAESVQARLSSPRRISLRCRLRALVRAYGRMLMEERCAAEPPRGARIFRRIEQAENLSVCSGLSDLLSLSCEFSGLSDDVRVVSAEGTPVVSEVRLEGNERVTASGELYLKLLLSRESGALQTISKSLPFSGEVELDGIDASYDFRGTATMSELSVEVDEGGRILCAPSVLIEVRGMKACEKRYTSDLFSSEYESRTETKSYRLPTVLRCERRNFSQSERIPLTSISLSEGATICDAWGSVLFDTCTMLGQNYVLSGQSRYTLLCEKNGEYSTCEVSLPIRYESDGGEGVPESFSAEGRVITCRVRAEGETLCLDAEISVSADFCGVQEIAAVREVRLGEACSSRGSCMTVYYPMSGEGAWEVAKKYRIAPDEISKGASYYYF